MTNSTMNFGKILLRTSSPMQIGDPWRSRGESEHDFVDRASRTQVQVVKDPDGNPWIPGPSVAGSMRAHFAADLPPTLAIEDLMGKVGDSDLMHHGGNARSAIASPVRILGTCVGHPAGDGSSGAVVARSQSTAVDRRTGAARNRTLRQEEHLVPGTTITVYVSWSGLTAEADQYIRDRLSCWQPQLGRAKSSGRGRTRLESLHVGTVDLATPAGKRLWLTESGPNLVESVAQEAIPVNETHADATVMRLDWDIRSDLFVGGEVTEEEGRQVHQVVMRDGQPVIPGSTWKGVFRSRAEWILRSIGLQACLEADCGACLTCGIFGWASQDSGSGEIGSQAKVIFSDSIVEGAGSALRTRSAIDRFTGGAADQLLFTSRVVNAGTVTMTIGSKSPLDSEEEQLLWLVVKDLDDGLIGVGSGTKAGRGTLRLRDSTNRDTARRAMISYDEGPADE